MCGTSTNDGVLAVHQWLTLREGRSFLSSHSVRCVVKKLMFLAMMWICPLYDKIENSFKHSISRGGWGSLILYVEEESDRVDFCKIVCRHQQFLLDPNYKGFDQLTVEIVWCPGFLGTIH